MLHSVLEIIIRSYHQEKLLIGLLCVSIGVIFYRFKGRDDWAWLKQFNCPSPALFFIGNLYEFVGHPTSNYPIYELFYKIIHLLVINI
jgi:hypothetical protein